MLLHFEFDGEERSLDVTRDADGWRLTLDGDTHTLAAAPARDGSWRIETADGRRRLWVAARGDDRYVFCDGQVVHLRLHDPERDDDDMGGESGPQLRARMPGKVVKVLVAVGDRVEVGQPLVLMESMKMETELAAGVAGVVREIHVAAAQIVGQDDALVSIEPDPDAERPV